MAEGRRSVSERLKWFSICLEGDIGVELEVWVWRGLHPKVVVKPGGVSALVDSLGRSLRVRETQLGILDPEAVKRFVTQCLPCYW